jgi:hypothetical protein
MFFSKVELSNHVRTICLPPKSNDNVHTYDLNTVTLTGWGNMFRNGRPSPTLSKALLTIFDYA